MDQFGKNKEQVKYMDGRYSDWALEIRNDLVLDNHWGKGRESHWIVTVRASGVLLSVGYTMIYSIKNHLENSQFQPSKIKNFFSGSCARNGDQNGWFMWFLPKISLLFAYVVADAVWWNENLQPTTTISNCIHSANLLFCDWLKNL